MKGKCVQGQDSVDREYYEREEKRLRKWYFNTYMVARVINPQGQVLVRGNRAQYPPSLMGNHLDDYPYELHKPQGDLGFIDESVNDFATLDFDEFLNKCDNDVFDVDTSEHGTYIKDYFERVMLHKCDIDIVRNERK